MVKAEQQIVSTSPSDITASSGGLVALSEGVRGTVVPSAAVPCVDRVGLGLGGRLARVYAVCPIFLIPASSTLLGRTYLFSLRTGRAAQSVCAGAYGPLQFGHCVGFRHSPVCLVCPQLRQSAELLHIREPCQ